MTINITKNKLVTVKHVHIFTLCATVLVPFESGSIVKAFVACFTLICTVIAMFSLVLLQMFFQVSWKVTGVALKYLTILFLDMYCELPLTHEPFPAVLHHTLESWVFPVNDLVGFLFTLKVRRVITRITLVSFFFVVVSMPYERRS